jgi:hypothetical protein
MSIGSGTFQKAVIGLLGGPIFGVYYAYNHDQNKRRLAELKNVPYQSDGFMPYIVGFFLTGLFYGIQCAGQEKEIKALESKQLNESALRKLAITSQDASVQQNQTKWQDTVNKSAESAIAPQR